MDMSQLTDADFSLNDMPFIRGAEAVENRSAVRVTLSHGQSYEIPIMYLQLWYSEGPHEISREPRKLEVKIVGDGDLLRVRLPDGSVYLVAWDVILMACEPDYVHFGGLTEYSKSTTKEWYEKIGPFYLQDSGSS